eukprot:c15911_g1_i3.p2 GENE.c15911_g1_i3~~c15911_g1_i3.p2  ORF type:complete len:174 (+),score=40.77 c15911_g1_i3:885-1406(+)
MSEGEAVYLQAGIIHAYLSGEGIEIMSTSDNVVRAGLTSKLKDVPVLLEISDFTASVAAVQPKPVLASDDSEILVFAPPVAEVPEFEVLRVKATNQSSVAIPASNGASTVVVVSGSARASCTPTEQNSQQGETSVLLQAGSTLLICAGCEIRLEGCQDLCLFRGEVNDSLLLQ